MIRCLVILMLFSANQMLAQGIVGFAARDMQSRTITFSAIKEGSAGTVAPDSILVRNLTKGRDTLLVGTSSFDIDWLTGVGTDGRLPAAFSMTAGFQDPSGETSSFHVTIPHSGNLQVRVFSLLGAEVASMSMSLFTGRHLFRFVASGIASGTYIVTASLGGERRALKISVLRAASSGPAQLSYGGESAMPLRKTSADLYTFIGYVLGCRPDTIPSIEPEAGRSYEFSFVPLPANDLLTGPSTEVAVVAVPIQGGTVDVMTPGTPVTGMQIMLPPQSYPDERTFSISYAEILNHGFDPKIRILSPLITLSNGGGYADSAMLIKIPIRLPAGYFAMAFFYDRDTKTLEGIPIIALTDDAVYVATQHLATDHLGFTKAAGQRRQPWIDVLVAGIETGELTGKITTPFSPGTDDWEYINWGSYLSPNGHCTAQSLTAIWYFTNKKQRGAAPLHNLLDEVHADSMWMDNVHGYRFASVVQKGLRWVDRSEWRTMYFERVGTTRISLDSLNYLAFAFAIQTTGLPQLTEIWRFDERWKGHAMVVYGTDKGSLLIADPNYPGANRGTKLELGKFIPYSSGDNAGVVGKDYPWIQYIANSAIVPVGDIAERWKQTFDGTIGTVPPYVYPETSLYVLYKDRQEILPETIETAEDTVIIAATCPTCASRLEANRTPVRLTDEFGRFITWADADGRLRIPVELGTTKYGVTVFGYSEAGKRGLGYIDFQWLQIKNIRPSIRKITPSLVKRGEMILIEGTNFGDDKTRGAVTIDSHAMTEISEWSDTAIRVKIPADAKSGYVRVRRDTAVSNAKWLSVDVPVTITSVTPSHGHMNDTITIRGTSLDKVIWVRFNEHMSPSMPPNAPGWNDSTIVARVPNDCVDGLITLILQGSGEVITGPHFTQDSVMISSAEPLIGPKDTVIVIKGEHFGQGFWPGTQVSIGGIKSDPVLSWTDTEIQIYGRNGGMIEVTVCGRTAKGGLFVIEP